VTNATESGTQQRTITLTDAEGTPTVTLAPDTTIAEDGGVATLRATLSNATTLPVTVALGFTGSADVDADYTRDTTQIVIPALSTSATVAVTSLNDAVTEGNETVVVDITGVTNATESGTQQATVTITDAEGTPTVTLAPDTTIAEDGGVATLRATLSNATTLPVTVALGFTGSADVDADYTRDTTQIVIPALSTSATLGVTSLGDAVFEGSETVVVDITGVTNATESGTQQATVTITDAEGSPTVTLAPDTTIAEDGGVATLRATLSNATTQAVTVTLGFSGTATVDADYTRDTTQLVIPALSTSATLGVTSLGDALTEGSETVVVDITGVTNATESGTQQATVTITDADAAAVTVADVSVVEGVGLLFTVTLDNAVAGAFTVDVTLTDGTATGGAAPLASPEDYDNVVATLNFAGTAGETQQFTVATLDDAVLEGSETFTVSLSASNPLVDDSDAATGTITDND
jgi:hypothetical protein